MLIHPNIYNQRKVAKLKGSNIYKSNRRPNGNIYTYSRDPQKTKREPYSHKSQFQTLIYNLNGFTSIISMKR